ncbi:Sedlin [Lasiodiplodia theobromae]|uniref:Sedlin n=1 Tax=Lasiodiplodia theobromae TaxID=45133 RepID=A0A5N5D5N2_9PEZI|nr:uncharacterized protein LTHEOB_11001 [Lasiodiplodia theobromae]KAB2572664.1 hypothetical protein DBV05_g8658 [Lasiodiplodia theobromae]KAF4538231.1 hypothetical protein LTHEOB_11001 [Lasiodiplodia theobromae]KAF9629103.1 Sedlin [Lasiodiplodia theobromae]
MGLSAALLEQWVEYPIGVTVCLLRLFARVRVVGWGNLYYDDLFAFLAIVFWTVETATIYLMNKYGNLIGLNDEKADALTDAQVHSLTIGSKAVFIAWLAYLCLIWSLKTSVLFYYNRLTKGLKEQRFIRILGWFVGLSWAAMMLQILLQCRPVQRNWQIKPYVGDDCTLTYARYYLLLILNVSTDIGLMAFIPAPILWKAQIPLKRKLLVALVLFSGIFIVAAAIIRCVMSVSDIRHIGTSGIWAIRETFVSLFTVNAPAIKPLFSRNRHNLGSSNKSSSAGAKYGSRSNGTTMKVSRHTACEVDEVELRSAAQWSQSGKDHESIPDLERGSSSGISIDGVPATKNDGLRIEVTQGFTTISEAAQGSRRAEEPRSWSEVAGHTMHDNTRTREGWT